MCALWQSKKGCGFVLMRARAHTIKSRSFVVGFFLGRSDLVGWALGRKWMMMVRTSLLPRPSSRCRPFTPKIKREEGLVKLISEGRREVEAT